MQYRVYGKTGKRVSVLGFGGMRLPEDDQEAYWLVRRACDVGINYFDTAPSYCNWRSERIIGRAIKDSGKKIFISNKSMVDYDPTADELRRRLELSLKNMQLEKIDFYNMWDVSSWEKFEKVMKKDGPYEGAVKAKAEGLIDHIALSTHADGETVKRMIETDLFEGVTVGYNIINADYRREGIDAARKKGIGIATMNSLAGGVIPRGREYFKGFSNYNHSAPIAIALRFVLMTPGVTVALSGMNRIEELEENIGVLDEEIHYDEEEVKEIQNLFRSLGHRFCTYCWYCLPCPRKIPIPQYLAAWNIARLENEGNTRSFIYENIVPLKNMNGLAEDCTKCGLCEERCTQGLNVISILEEMGSRYDKFITAERSKQDKVISCK